MAWIKFSLLIFMNMNKCHTPENPLRNYKHSRQGSIIGKDI